MPPIQDHGLDPSDLDNFVAQLRQAVADLWYPSETDAPLDVVVWPVADLDEEGLGRQISQQTGRGAESAMRQSPDQFFRPVLDNPFWHSPQGNHLAQRYDQLRHLLEQQLVSLCSYRMGQVEGEVYLIGRHSSGAWVGLHSTWVET